MVKFIKFCIVGSANTIITIATFNILIYLNINYLYSNIFSYLLGICNSYFLNSRWSFRLSYSKKKFIQFLMINILVLAFNTKLLYLFVNLMGINVFYSQIITTVVGIFINFLLSRFLIFR